MKIVVQRVKRAKVLVDGKTFSAIGKGYVALVGFCRGDDEKVVLKMAKKLASLRVMADEKKKMNYDLKTAKGELLVISQFTLCADTSQRRPSFILAEKEDKAKKLYDLFIKTLKSEGLVVKTGKFGCYSEVVIVNDGPVTIILEN